MIFDTLPPQFCLQDLSAITGRVCELRVNPHQAEADRAARVWFNRYVIPGFLVVEFTNVTLAALVCTMTGNDPSS